MQLQYERILQRQKNLPFHIRGLFKAPVHHKRFLNSFHRVKLVLLIHRLAMPDQVNLCEGSLADY